MNIQWKNLITCLAIPLAVGSLSSLLTRSSMETFEAISKPALAPPGFFVPGGLDHPVYPYGNCIVSGAHVRQTKRYCSDCIRNSACI